jgi:hypothetical protein
LPFRLAGFPLAVVFPGHGQKFNLSEKYVRRRQINIYSPIGKLFFSLNIQNGMFSWKRILKLPIRFRDVFTKIRAAFERQPLLASAQIKGSWRIFLPVTLSTSEVLFTQRSPYESPVPLLQPPQQVVYFSRGLGIGPHFISIKFKTFQIIVSNRYKSFQVIENGRVRPLTNGTALAFF